MDKGESLGELVDRTDHEWVEAWRWLSLHLIVEMLGWAGPAADQLWLSRSLDELSLRVSWAQVDPALLWLDAARDLTEDWVHERQPRTAVCNHIGGIPHVATVSDVFAGGLPYTTNPYTT